jgi:hypothetical protein
VSNSQQLFIDRAELAPAPADEAAARRSLRAQVARLEREQSQIIASAFPHIPLAAARGADGWLHGIPAARDGDGDGPRLLSFEQLEVLRDELAARLQELRRRVDERALHERRAHELLEAMKLEPGRYKFVRLPVRDLGQGGCGVWEVRPRLGLIGMLAGWWQLTLSSGCPLAMGRALRATRSNIAATTSRQLHRGNYIAATTDARRSRLQTAPSSVRPHSLAPSIIASVCRWRSVIEPTCFVSLIGT